MSQSQQGQLIQADFFDNTGGLNLSDSPMRVADNEAVAGYNFDLLVKGGIKKRKGHTLLNGSPDAQLQSFGFGLWSDTSVPANKTVVK